MKPSGRFLYTALGDSITEGYSAPHKRGYVNLLACRLRREHPSFRLRNAGRKGWTSRRLLLRLRHSPRLLWAVGRADLLTLWIGGNDLIFAYIKGMMSTSPHLYEQALTQYLSNMDQIFARIHRVRSRPFLVCNLYNPFPNSGFARQWVGEFNQVLGGMCNRWAIPMVDIHSVFLGREAELIHGYRNGTVSDIPLIGRRPVHPNRRGHEVIANTLWGVIHS
ncbi:lipolytic enzyme LipC [Desmospora sp. 8437]|nr:lipolytic enzyme LipC [Desmospora sp. 8437]